MNNTTKGILMNAIILVSLGFFYFQGASSLVLLISAVILLTIVNVLLIFGRNGKRANSLAARPWRKATVLTNNIDKKSDLPPPAKKKDDQQ